jgi:hypothetical protein
MKHKARDGQLRRIAVAASVWALAMVPAGAAQVEVSNPGTTVSKDADPSRALGLRGLLRSPVRRLWALRELGRATATASGACHSRFNTGGDAADWRARAVSRFQKGPGRRGADAGPRRAFVGRNVRSRADHAALNRYNSNHNSTEMPRHFKWPQPRGLRHANEPASTQMRRLSSVNIQVRCVVNSAK